MRFTAEVLITFNKEIDIKVFADTIYEVNVPEVSDVFPHSREGKEYLSFSVETKDLRRAIYYIYDFCAELKSKVEELKEYKIKEIKVEEDDD